MSIIYRFQALIILLLSGLLLPCEDSPQCNGGGGRPQMVRSAPREHPRAPRPAPPGTAPAVPPRAPRAAGAGGAAAISEEGTGTEAPPPPRRPHMVRSRPPAGRPLRQERTGSAGSGDCGPAGHGQRERGDRQGRRGRGAARTHRNRELGNGHGAPLRRGKGRENRRCAAPRRGDLVVALLKGTRREDGEGRFIRDRTRRTGSV